MGGADDHPGPGASSDAHGLRLDFPGDAPSVRAALRAAMTGLRGMGLDDAQPGVVEIVLAEVLNNVVEHAYAGTAGGRIEVTILREATALAFRIRDDGARMPGGDAPAGRVHDLGVAIQDLPEGGFGWMLIRELTDGLAYRRVGDRNELTFRIALDATMPGR